MTPNAVNPQVRPIRHSLVILEKPPGPWFKTLFSLLKCRLWNMLNYPWSNFQQSYHDTQLRRTTFEQRISTQHFTMKLHLASWLVCALATADAVGASNWFSKASEFEG
jgi:hypothetical protein